MKQALAAFLLLAAPTAAFASRHDASGTVSVAAILVTWAGETAPDRTGISAQLFADGDTLNARLREATGGTRGITGKVFGPVIVDAPRTCDLRALYDRAAAATGADLTSYGAALILGPKASCDFASTVKGPGSLVVTGAFGTDWVAAAADGLKQGLDAAATPTRAATKVARARKPASKLLTLASVIPYLNAPELVAETGMRDAPASLPAPGAVRVGAGFRVAPMLVPPSTESNQASGGAVLRNASGLAARPAYRLDATACMAGARNLRGAVKVAREMHGTSGAAARRELAAALRRELARIRRHDMPDEAEVSLLTTSAETELDAALMRLEDFRQSPTRLGTTVAASAARAAKDLELAARRLARR